MTDMRDLRIDYVTRDDKQYNAAWIQKGHSTACLFNNYPKEWLINEAGQDGLLKYDFEELNSFEPFWKLILGNKAILPFLY